MALSPADFYAYSRATGAPIPEDAEERARMAPDVYNFRQNQLKTSEQSPNYGAIAGLSALGQQQQAQRQAELEAQKQLEFQRIYQPLQTAQQYGAGITPLIAGYPQQTQIQATPSPTALQTGLGTLATLAGIYKTFNPSPIQLKF